MGVGLICIPKANDALPIAIEDSERRVVCKPDLVRGWPTGAWWAAGVVADDAHRQPASAPDCAFAMTRRSSRTSSEISDALKTAWRGSLSATSSSSLTRRHAAAHASRAARPRLALAASIDSVMFPGVGGQVASSHAAWATLRSSMATRSALVIAFLFTHFPQPISGITHSLSQT